MKLNETTKILYLAVLIICISSCKVNEKQIVSSKWFLQQVAVQDSVDIWTSQGYLHYDEEDKEIGPFYYRKGYAKIITNDSIFDFAMYYGHFRSTSCSISGNELRTKDRVQKMEFSGNVMYLKTKEVNPQYSSDTLEHIFVESYLLRKVSASELSKLLSTKDSTYTESTLLGISITDWATDEGTASYERR